MKPVRDAAKRRWFLTVIAATSLTAPCVWAQATPSTSRPTVRMDDDELALGSVDAPVTVVVYLSTTCTHCAAFAIDTLPTVEGDFIATGKVRLIIRELPTAPVAVAAAGFLLARCTGRENYWSIVRGLLSRQALILSSGDTDSMLRATMTTTNLDASAIRSCLSDDAAIAALNARRRAALEAGIDSTPTFFFDGVRLAAGIKLGTDRYLGGELSLAQWRAAYARAIVERTPSTQGRQRRSP